MLSSPNRAQGPTRCCVGGLGFARGHHARCSLAVAWRTWCLYCVQQLTHDFWAPVQIKDLNSGTFGFVQLARDKLTGETWAVKFIERGDKVNAAWGSLNFERGFGVGGWVTTRLRPDVGEHCPGGGLRRRCG